MSGYLVCITCTRHKTDTIGQRLLEIIVFRIVRRLVRGHKVCIIGMGVVDTCPYVYLMVNRVQREPIYTRPDIKVIVQMVMDKCIAMSRYGVDIASFSIAVTHIQTESEMPAVHIQHRLRGSETARGMI